MKSRIWSLSLFMALVLTGGCAAPMRGGPAAQTADTAPLPQSHEGARAELDRLERRIALDRRGLGLAEPERAESAPAPASVAPVKVKAARRAPDDESIDMADDPVPVAAAEKAEEAARPYATAPLADGGASAPPPCSQSCKLVRAICHAASRICRIADYLGDPDAATRCSRARADCVQARQATPTGCERCQ